jgi:hypothetical protein
LECFTITFPRRWRWDGIVTCGCRGSGTALTLFAAEGAPGLNRKHHIEKIFHMSPQLSNLKVLQLGGTRFNPSLHECHVHGA